MQKKLSNYSVMALYQDTRGLIWIGTRNGINVYDGTHIQTYQTNHQDSTEILHNHIMDIKGDRDGIIYVLSRQGVNTYYVSEDRYETITDKDVMAIRLYNKELLMAVDNKILRYNPKNKEITDYYTLPDKQTTITDFALHGDSLLVGTELDGLYIYNTTKRMLSNPIQHIRVSKLFVDSGNDIWIGSWKHGAYRIKGDKIMNYMHRSDDGASLRSNFVRTFCEDDLGNIWVGTFRGLNCFDKLHDSFDAVASDSENGLANTSVWSLLCDSQGTVWVGTYFEGVSYFNPAPSLRRYFQDGKEGGRQITVGAMAQDNEGVFWICTDGNGLCKLNEETGEIKWFKHDSKRNSLSHNNVKSIYFDEAENALWIGTHMGGLNKLDLATEKFTNYFYYPSDKQEDKSNTICEIQPHGDDLILATHAGVFMFNRKTEKFKSVFNGDTEVDNIDFAFDVLLDSDSILWISGDKKGLYSYDFQSDELTRYSQDSKDRKISSNMVNCSFKDSKNRLWMCMAETGIELFDPKTETFTNFNKKDNHLLNNCVYGACEIAPDKLIFIMDNGLSYLDVEKKAFRNFLVNENIPLTALNQNAIYHAKNGDIYIGGIDGMISFRTDMLDRHAKDYNIFPMKLYINDKEIKVNDDTGILSEALCVTKRIQLEHKHSMFSIVYSAPNYFSAYKDEIVYKLENFSDTWSMLRPDNYVTYTNLNPGVYKLLVKSNSKHRMDSPISELEIEVLPPWYRTLWAYAIYLIVTVIVLRIIIRVYKNRLKLQTELEYERKHIEDVEKLNKQKLQFFTNISHEFRTPLTLIIGEVELLMQVKSFLPAVYNRILNVYKSSMQLQSLISELLDFRKQEQGHMHIKACEHNIVRFIRENYLLFKEYALTKNVDFLLENDSDEVMVYYDEKQMQKVINNLLSNAFKHTPANERIIVKIEDEETQVKLSVTNFGAVIPPKVMERLFDRFYQSDEDLISINPGTGIGLALTKGIVELHHGTINVTSTKEEGTTFQLVLKKGKEHFGEDELTTVSVNYECQPSQVQLPEVTEMETPTDFQDDTEKKYKVLLVEDDLNLLDLLKDIFDPFYQTEIASSAEQALEMIAEIQPDLVVSDVQMPGMSGLELCKKIKKDIDTCHIPVVLLTARTALEHKLEGLNTGADDYIVKPFDTNILLARCRNLINNRIVLQEKFTNQPQESSQVFATNQLDKEFMDKALKIIEDNIENYEFSATKFAQEMAVARTKLFIKIKAITGQTPNDLIVTMRLKKAAYLLKNDFKLSVSEISDKTGFKTPRYFSRCFRERYKVTPLNYRKGKLPEDNQVEEPEAEAETEK